MAFVPRSFTQILTDSVAYVQSRTTYTDFTVGSAIRTVLEAAALEDDEQYFQMVQLLDIFSYTTAAGEDLDRRLADFNIFRLQARPSFGEAKFINTNLIQDDAATDSGSGNTSVVIFDSTGFPVTGYPYTIRIAEGTNRAQDAVVSFLNTLTNTFTVGALVRDVEIGDRVALITGASPYTVAPSTNIQAPATSSESAKIYRTSEVATIPAGNYYSNLVNIVATTSGTSGDAGIGRVSQFVGAPSFAGASVTNPNIITGGALRESDGDFRARAVEKLQSLSKGTVLALKASSVGVTDQNTSQRVISSNVLEDFAGDPEEVIVYIDDGTGFTPDTVSPAFDSVAAGFPVSAGDATITVDDASDFPSTGFVLVNEDFLLEYVSVEVNVLTLASLVPVGSSASVGDTVRRIDYLSTGTEAGQRRFQVNNPPVVRNTERIYIKALLDITWTLLVANTDYILNKGTGEFSIIDTGGLGAGTQVIAYYDYYTNLVAEVQKVLEGDPDDSVSYPGVKAAGIFLAVEAPVFRRITVRLSIAAEVTFVESELAPLVQLEIETYIRGLKIGNDVIRSRIIDSAHNVQGVKSVLLTLPTENVIVLENELPVPFDSSGNSLVTVL